MSEPPTPRDDADDSPDATAATPEPRAGTGAEAAAGGPDDDGSADDGPISGDTAGDGVTASPPTPEPEPEPAAEDDADPADPDAAPDDPDPDAEPATPDGAIPDTPVPDGPTPDGRQQRRRRRLQWIALGTAVLVTATAGVAWAVVSKLDGNIRTDASTAAELSRHEDSRPRPAPTTSRSEVPRNILLLGSDTRTGQGKGFGQDEGSARSDTTILLHLSAGDTRATAVSIPRDLMVDIPSCTRADGSTSDARTTQFNTAFTLGGAACTIRTVERLTGVRVDHHLVVDFRGFEKMVDAVGGVEICLPKAVEDEDAKLDLPAGRQVVDGEDALAYVRTRKAFDGSDTQRMGRQQRFLGAMVKRVGGSDVLLDPRRLYPLLDAATGALTADAGLDSLRELVGLANSLRTVPRSDVRFLTVPRQPYRYDSNRDELRQPKADELFAKLRADEPVKVRKKGDDDDSYEGSTAAEDTCGQD